jgi:hypothetical protein
MVLILSPFLLWSQETEYDVEAFVREGFGFTYAEDELSSLSVFYENHGQPIEAGESISVNRMDGVIDKIILLEYENFFAKFIQYGERNGYNGPKEELMNISSKDGVNYLYGIRNGMEIAELFGLFGKMETFLGNSIWIGNEQGNIAILYIEDDKLKNIIWLYKMPQ